MLLPTGDGRPIDGWREREDQSFVIVAHAFRRLGRRACRIA